MRMRVHHAGIPVGRPAGMAYTAGAGQRPSLIRLVRQMVKFPGGLYDLRRFRAVAHGKPGRIITPVFKPGQPVQQDRRRLYMPCVSDYSAHALFLQTNKRQRNLPNRTPLPCHGHHIIISRPCQYIIIHYIKPRPLGFRLCFLAVSLLTSCVPSHKIRASR